MQRPELSDILIHYPEISGVHPACTAVPDISDEDYLLLLESIKDGGLLHSIVLTPDGLLLDGRNRLMASYEAMKDVRFTTTIIDPWHYAYDANISRRHLTTFQRAVFADRWREDEEVAAKERMLATQNNNAAKSSSGNISGTGDKGDSRDKAASRVGISGKSLDKYKDIKAYAPPEVYEQAKSGKISLEAAHRQAIKEKKAKESQPIEKPSSGKGKKGKGKKGKSTKTTPLVTIGGGVTEIASPATVRFNQTNESVDWAKWTWNPVTGCLHGCKFCYAREIANMDRMKDYYPNKFEPTFHEYRLEAPKNTPVPKGTDDERDGRVFVCSMADLFGKWVPDEWIRKVFDACLETPEWEYLFLTKWPNRYAQMPLLEKAWYGASVIQQSDVARVEAAMANFETDCIKWISMEPMLTPVQFDDLSWCDLMVIGAQTSTNQPEGHVPAFSPDFDWIVDVVNQCRDQGVPYYLKDNLLSAPGMRLTKSSHRKAMELAHG